jgi:hypothetical protein
VTVVERVFKVVARPEFGSMKSLMMRVYFMNVY